MDEIPFKALTFWNENDKPEVRRFGIERGFVESYYFLNQKLLELYPGLAGKIYNVAWKDEEGDDVLISSDKELVTALKFMRYEFFKIYVYVKGETKVEQDKNDAQPEECNIFVSATAVPHCPAMGAGGLHYGVVCDSCNNPIVGFRYKCTVCDDFDLCSQCESAGCHPEHCMVRVPTPTMPRTLIKAAIKRSRHFLKSVAINTAEDCHSKRRRDKSGDRKHRGHHGHHGPHGPHGPHGSHGPHGPHHGDSHRRSRPSWLETFTTYMNEFANLAGDIDLNDDSKPQETKPQEQKPQEGTENTKTAGSTEAPQPPKPSTSSNAQTQCPFIPGVDVNNIKGLLQMFLQDLQPVPTTSQTNDVEMGQGDRKASEPNINMNTEAAAKAETPVKSEPVVNSDTPATSAASANSDVSVKSESSYASSLNDVPRDISPEKADDWTLINNEKDLLGTSIPTELVAPIGFNLPKEFQERVKISEGGLYPPLNTSTAVLNPKVPEVGPQAPPSAPQPEAEASKPVQEKPTPAAPQPKPQPRARHPKPHVEAAINQMLAMGFTNEGGWLTQLLDSKDGNIAAVLDLLTPVNPKK